MADETYCYNKGCTKQVFKLSENQEDSCTYHPGVAVFHDAYKGWSCCKKKCTDFTEFLNIKGCTTGPHCNIKPPEPEKPVVSKENASEVIEVRAPLEAAPARLPRPPFDTPLVTIKPNVAASLASQVNQLTLKTSLPAALSDEITLGTSCKHKGCSVSYQGPVDTPVPCRYHPGVPVFHEGLKFWSCCKKRTTEFSAFLEQVGCSTGDHLWVEDVGAAPKPVCRHDWHQTGSLVIISIFAKKYHPEVSKIQLNPIRVKVDLFFPEDNTRFEMDLETRGVIDVEKSEVSMLGTKVEIKLKKAELGTWSLLEFPRDASSKEPVAVKSDTSDDSDVYDDACVDLSSL